MSIPVSLELYSVRKSLSADLVGTLEKVKSYGYEAVEFAGTPEHPACDYYAALKSSGLVCSGWHYSYEPLFGTDEEFKKAVDFHLAVGNRSIIIPWIPDEMLNSYDALKKTAEKLNSVSEKLAKYGLRTGYHNHSAEFKILPESGLSIWSTLRTLTVPDFVMQLDTGNAMNGGGNATAEILASPGRAQIIHLKPYSYAKGYETVIGADNDDTDYASILKFCASEGKTEFVVVEYECETLYSDMEGVRVCIDNLKAKYGALL